jgi:antitoxin component of MazEF toxin-antitoxin module
MKIQKRFLRKHKNKNYYKCVVNIPPMVLKEAGLDYGEDVEIKAEKGKIVLKKKKRESKNLKHSVV